MLNGHLGVVAEIPFPGPVVCVFCRALSICTELGELRRPTDGEESVLLADPSVLVAIQAVGRYHEQFGIPQGGRHG